MDNTHLERVYETAQLALSGILSGPNFNLLLVNAMQASQRLTLGSIVVDEAWDMAEVLVDKYESKISTTSEGP